MRTKLLALVLGVCLIAGAQMKMTVEQLVSFVKSSIKLGHDDKRVAEYLKKVTLSNGLDAQRIEEMQGMGAGFKTMEALRALQEASKSLPKAPAPPPVAPPKPVEVINIPAPAQDQQDKILSDVRTYALDYLKQLPNFICVQRTLRYYDPSGLESWSRDATITAQLTFFEQKEEYKILMVDDRATTGMSFEKMGGATSTGEFGSMLKEIFEPSTRTSFQWERWATLRGRRMYVFSYVVAQPQSRWSIRYQRSEQVTPGYRGLIYIDRDTGMVMRVTLEANDIPTSFPVQQASQALDYDFVKIADREYVLPLKSVMRMREARMLVKNEIEFRLYRKFGAEATIKAVDFDSLPPLPESTSTETPAVPQKPTQKP